MDKIRTSVINEQKHILDFWLKMQDDEYGGFYCSMSYDLKVDKQADKSGVAAARNLWTFSKAYNMSHNDDYLKAANNAYQFLINNLMDNKNKGAFLILSCEGKPTDKRKHIYLQAFCIYALSEYYKATKNSEAKETALELFDIIETTGYDKTKRAYKEEFTIDWKEKDNELISENGIIAKITTNTHLHVLEAYTNLYLVEPSEKVKNALLNIVDIFYENIYSKQTHHQKVFFDTNWNEVINLQSYGHDIEASWLIDDALKTLNSYDAKYDEMVVNIADKILKTAILDDGSIANECENGVVDYTRIWWVQAEAAIGFYNAYTKTKEEKYLNAFKGVWNYILEYIVDKRENGEWLYGRDGDNSITKKAVVELWKTPYHNARCTFTLNEWMMEDEELLKLGQEG